MNATLRLDMAALVANWRLVAARGGTAECSAVVKADAYGIGQTQASLALSKAGCKTFFVAIPSEGEALRKLVPDAVIYVLNGLFPGASAFYAANKLRPVLGDVAEVREWMQGDFGPAALHFDTGMNRLGLSEADAAALAADTTFSPALVMSHFVSSERRDDAMNDQQIAALKKRAALYPSAKISMANSSGIFLPQKPHFDLTRPGYALYGGNPTPDAPNPMQTVVYLEAPIVQVRDVPVGARVGYNNVWSAQRPTRLAAISTGYADGLLRSAMGAPDHQGGEAVVHGVRCPFVGRVSMDLIVLDVTDAPAPQRGDRVELLGTTISVDELGERAGTIGYEILTSLGHRYTRKYD